MVSLKLQKRLASSVLKCVRHRSWNNSPREASSCITEGVEFIARSYPNPSTSPRHRTPSILPKTISPWATLPKKIEAYDPDPKERFTAAMQQCLQIFGPNKMEEKEKSKFLGFMWNPLSWVMEAAVIMAIALANGGVGSRRIGRTLSASPPCLLSTPPSDSSRRPMPATPPPRSWPVSCPKPRFFATAGGPMKTWPSSCQGTSSASSSMTSYLQMHLSWSETSQDWSGPSPAKKRLISLP